MMNEAWYVLFAKRRVPRKGDVLTLLRKIRNASVTDQTAEGEMTFLVAVGAVSFMVGLNTRPHIRGETREIVSLHRESLVNAGEIETYDARIELWFDQDYMADLFEPVLVAAERLAKLTAGVIYEANNGVFQDA